MTILAPQGTTGDVAVPISSNAVKVRLDGNLVFRNGKIIGRRLGPQLANGYVTLHGVRAGRHSVIVNRSH